MVELPSYSCIKNSFLSSCVLFMSIIHIDNQLPDFLINTVPLIRSPVWYQLSKNNIEKLVNNSTTSSNTTYHCTMPNIIINYHVMMVNSLMACDF